MAVHRGEMLLRHCLAFNFRKKKQGTEPDTYAAGKAQRSFSSQTARTINEIAADKRSHCSASWSKALRPAFVSL